MLSVFTSFDRVCRLLAARAVSCLFLAAAIVTQPYESAAKVFPEAMARIVYTADTLGYLYPCASCGNNAQGGIARRAALLRQLAGGRKKPLIIAGPNEFPADGTEYSQKDQGIRMRVMRDALARMPYSGIVLSPAAAASFQAHGLPPLKNEIRCGKKPVTEYYRAGELAAACIFFPPGEEQGELPSERQVQGVLEAAREAGNSVSLVIGVSSWGMHAENALMERFGSAFHVILGGGRGIAVPGQAANSGTAPGPVWARSGNMGRAVSVLDIYSFPEKGGAWLDGIHFVPRLIFLEKNLPEDEEVAKIISAVSND